MFRVHDLRQLTREHPAQWIGRTEDGRRLFVHAKWGWLRVRVAVADASKGELLSAEPVIDVEFGHEHDPCPLWEEVEALTGLQQVGRP